MRIIASTRVSMGVIMALQVSMARAVICWLYQDYYVLFPSLPQNRLEIVPHKAVVYPAQQQRTHFHSILNLLGLVAESEYIEFESMVCYAFLTRFPLFDFFFQVIFDLINTGTSVVYYLLRHYLSSCFVVHVGMICFHDSHLFPFIFKCMLFSIFCTQSA